MSVYLKLQQVREELSKLNLKKTGENKFSKYNYYELGDILPSITALCNKYKLCNIVNFSEQLATLTIVNSEKADEHITFTSPIAEAEMKGVQAIQRLGAEQTYLRRYLYMNAFEIVEADVIDETNNSNEPKVSLVKDTHIKALHTKLTAKGITDVQKKEYLKMKYNIESSKDLTVNQFKEMMKYLDTKADIQNNKK